MSSQNKHDTLSDLKSAISDLQAAGEISPQLSMEGNFEAALIHEIELDSLARMALAIAIEERTGAIMNESDFSSSETIGELVALIESRREI